MSAQLHAELFKQRSTMTGRGLLAGMLGLVLVAVLLHGFGLGAESLDSASEQLTVLFGRGQLLGALFAALIGATSVTGEVRHGTIRPTLLATPARRRVVAAKVQASMLVGAGFGLAAGALAAGVGTVVLKARAIDVQPDAGDYALFVAGAAAGAALWAVIGVGVGAAVRNQVPALVGICVWLLFVESLLGGDLGVLGDVGRFAPGLAAAAASGQDPDTLLGPGAGLVLLTLYAAAAAAAAALATDRRDIA